MAQQNYEVFKDCADKGIFPNLDPYLINTEVSGEETLFIPDDHNVYVLPRDLFKKNGRLMQGPMTNFLLTMTEDYFGKGKKKKIYLVKDECHQATNNLDAISEKVFTKILNFSATPNLRRGQMPDVQITDEEAVQAFEYLSRMEGIIPAVESAHAVAHAMKLVPTMGRDQIVVINISGRGDKDCAAIARYRGEDIHD